MRVGVSYGNANQLRAARSADAMCVGDTEDVAPELPCGRADLVRGAVCGAGHGEIQCQ